jgi:metal-responsive CopG/Arc/MetJ family transcriptional regulator
MMKNKTVTLYVKDGKLMEEVEKVAKEHYMSKSRFTMLAWRMYLKYIKKHKEF